jgi:hypothetical protein
LFSPKLLIYGVSNQRRVVLPPRATQVSLKPISFNAFII